MTSVPALTTGARINLRSLCMDAPLGANLNKCLRKGGFNNKPLSKAKTLIPLDLHNTTQISGLGAAFNGFPVTRGTRYIYRIYMCMAWLFIAKSWTRPTVLTPFVKGASNSI